MNIQTIPGKEPKVVLRSAPDPGSGQDRVQKTVRHAVEAISDTSATMYFREYLGQGPMGKNGSTGLVSNAVAGKNGIKAMKAQNKAVLTYIQGLDGASSPLKDYQEYFSRCAWEMCRHMFMALENSSETKSLAFTLIRHGEKGEDGKLTELGIQQAETSGKSISAKNNTPNTTPITGIYGIQQPIAHALALALEATSEDNFTTNDLSETNKKAWNKLPEAWRKEPMQFAEMMDCELSLKESFSNDEYAGKNKKGDKLEYINNNLEIKLTLRDESKTYDVKNLRRFA